MSFIEDLRKAQQDEADARQQESDIINSYNNRLDSAATLYKDYYKIYGLGNLSDSEAQRKLREFIYKNGIEDGKWKNEDYDELEFQKYGSELLDKLFDGAQSFDDYVKKNGSKSVQRTYDSVKSRKENPGAFAGKLALGGTVLGAAAAGGPAMFYPAAGVFGAGAMIDKKNQGTLDDMYTDYQKSEANVYDNAFKLVENYDKYSGSAAKNKKEAAATEETASDTSASNGSDEETEGEEITYTYKPGDTFGQVIMNLGLNTEKGLWGDDGDVAFYDKQLWEQGAPDPVTGNIPVGTTIKLRRRKV